MTLGTCGCETLARGLAGTGLQGAFGVPGKPVTHLLDVLAESYPGLEWALNEKSAVEAAVGLSWSGGRSVVVLKQAGLNVALDPLINAVYHGIRSGLVVIVGDDVGASSSTCEQDSRILAQVAGLPVLEVLPSSSVEKTVHDAFALSEEMSSPVLLRVLPHLHRPAAPKSWSPLPIPQPRQPISMAESRELAFGLTKLGRHQRHRLHRWPSASRFADTEGIVLKHCQAPCSTGVIMVGGTAEPLAVQDFGQDVDACLLVVGVSWPVPAAVHEFLRRHEHVLVCEEPSPVLETSLLSTAREASTRLAGRLNGDLPPEGPVLAEMVQRFLRSADETCTPWEQVDRKSFDGHRAAHPYADLFDEVKYLHDQGAFVATDVGSSVELCYPPWEAADVALCLGSSIGVAGGAARSGRKAIAVIGDYALVHSGIEPLLDIGRRDLSVLVLVLANGTMAKTGGQPSPARLQQPDGFHPVSLAELVVKGCGIRLLGDISLGELPDEVLHEQLQSWFHEDGARVAILREGEDIA